MALYNNASFAPITRLNRAVLLYVPSLPSNSGIAVLSNLISLKIPATPDITIFASLWFVFVVTSTWIVSRTAFMSLPSKSAPYSTPGSAWI